MRALLLALALLLSGCIGAATEAAEPSLAAAPTSPAVATEPVVIVEHGVGSSGDFELDLLCAVGGGMEIPRSDRSGILPGVKRLVATIEMPSGTGLQLGYTIDDGDVVWLPPVRPGTTTVEIPVTPDQTEENGSRWSFYHQANLPEPATQECYTGVLVNGWKIKIETGL